MSTAPDLDTQPLGADRPLLRLPAELRNEIYRLVLCKNDSIVVSSTGYEREGLLSVCKKVRQEALKIYYYENTFHIEVHKWNSDNWLAFERVTKQLGIKRSRKKQGSLGEGEQLDKLTVDIWFTSKEPSWKNLLKWMRRVHAGRLPGPTKPPQGDTPIPRSLTMIGFEIMIFTARKLTKQPWSSVRLILDCHRAILGHDDSRWLED